MRLLSVTLCVISCTPFLTSNALPIDGTNGSLESRTDTIFAVQGRDSFADLANRGTPAKAGAFVCKKKAGAKKAKRDYSLVPRAADSSSAAFWKATGDLAAAITAQKIPYVITGGTAVAALGGTRTTKDIDLVLHNAWDSIPVLKAHLPGRFEADEYCSTITMDGIELDIFDPASWPERPYAQYLTHTFPVHAPHTGATILVLNPTVLLQDKTKSASDRAGTAKGPNDAVDVKFLQQYIQGHHLH